ncbi:protein kinase [Streptomyces rimosus]|uniref:protein kinase n=1 Tax=Streptomyces rimosus TaxID=1927 RepID=UPI0004C75D21|nr:protein kinase [Streptomyces rimosus]
MEPCSPCPLPNGVAVALTPTGVRLVTNRRGSTVWDVRTAAERYAVKVGRPVPETDEHPGCDWAGVAPAREAVVLQLLETFAVYGTWPYGTWNAQPWHEGPSLYELWEPQRSGEREPSLDAAHACADALAVLHEAGWVHGDIQPAHLIIGPDGTATLIDLALARGGPVPDSVDFPYPGSLVHFESPEISRSLLETGTVAPTSASDVYALGASFFVSATGWRHVDYPDDAPRTVQRKAVATTPHRPVTVPGLFGRLIEAMLSPLPGDRPTSAEVRSVLAHQP